MVAFIWRALLMVGLMAPGPALAQGGDGGMMSGGGGASGGLSATTTRQVVDILNRAGGECGGLPEVYRYDCYRFAYKRAADALVGQGAYREAYAALAEVERVLEREVARNADPAARPVRRGLASYRAVRPEAVPAVEARAVAALEEAETVLLRSAGDKGVHYVSIAEAVSSNKVLIRSDLLPGPGPSRRLLA